MSPKRFLRSVLAIFAGIVAISVVVEGLEFVLVALVRGEPTTEPEAFYAVRNAAWFLAVKLVYNTGAALGAGYLAALIAGYAEFKHGLVLAAVQTLAVGAFRIRHLRAGHGRVGRTELLTTGCQLVSSSRAGGNQKLRRKHRIGGSPAWFWRIEAGSMRGPCLWSCRREGGPVGAEGDRDRGPEGGLACGFAAVHRRRGMM